MPSPDEMQLDGSTDEGRLFPITTRPGIKRDGTDLDGNYWVDGQHARFQRGRAKKMGGWRSITPYFDGPLRKMWIDSRNGRHRLFGGSASSLQFADVTDDGIGSSVVSITPTIASGFVPHNNNTWQFAQLFDATSNTSRLLAHAAPNLGDIGSTVDRQVWFGNVAGLAPLANSTAPQVSGGILAAAPYAIAYGNDGVVLWTPPNLPDDWVGAGSGDARVTEHKIVYGKKIRGGSGQSPAFLLWSLSAVLRTTFIGGTATFAFDTIAENISILSSSCVVEYDGLIYWIGVDRFMIYNGVIDELPNDMNINFFFDGLNWAHRQKVWGMAVPRYGEIWWFYPRGTSTECNAAIIYNKRLNTWYDTMMERSAGIPAQVFRWPVMADTIPSDRMVRQLGGTPATSDGGTAANAFDGNPATECVQVAPSGNISYDFGINTTKTIRRVGVMTGASATYDLVFEKSDDATNWSAFFEPGSIPYTTGVDVYFDLQAPVTARAFRVREDSGGTLELAEVYFDAAGTFIHQHEFGYDRIIGNVITSIRSYVETANLAYMTTGPLGDRWLGQDQAVKLSRIEPDLLQVGLMTVDVIGKRYAKDATSSTPIVMTETESYLSLTEQARQMRLRFTSDAQNGYFELGEMVLKLSPGDENW